MPCRPIAVAELNLNAETCIPNDVTHLNRCPNWIDSQSILIAYCNVGHIYWHTQWLILSLNGTKPLTNNMPWQYILRVHLLVHVTWQPLMGLGLGTLSSCKWSGTSGTFTGTPNSWLIMSLNGTKLLTNQDKAATCTFTVHPSGHMT